MKEKTQPRELNIALKLADEMSRLEGEPKSALKEGQMIAKRHGLGKTHFDELENLLEALRAKGLDESTVVLDLGLARGIAYYSGVIFELFHSTSDDQKTLGGGGRYDGLIKALGGDETPALGFAYTLDQIIKSLKLEKSGTHRVPKKTEE
mgnify:CR=1 FL=1